ncbi:MAG: hypothetical protein AABX47_10580 [Nanoarchaeota archaeon]
MKNFYAVSLKDKIRESLVEQRNTLCHEVIKSHPEHSKSILTLEKEGPRVMMLLAPAAADQVWNFFLENALGVITTESKEQYNPLRERDSSAAS